MRTTAPERVTSSRQVVPNAESSCTLANDPAGAATTVTTIEPPGPAEAGLRYAYLQFDGVGNAANSHRAVGNLFDVKLRAIENLHSAGVDIVPVMLKADGTPKDIFVEDNLHMTPEGYRLWTPVVDAALDAGVARTGALDYARECAVRESESAAACVAGLPPSPHKENLLELASFAARRSY